jgi:hypothetical protein
VRRERLLALVAQDKGHATRLDPLQACKQLGIEAELQHALHLGGQRELRVGRLVRPRPRAARLGHAHKKVGAPEPLSPLQRALVDDVDPAPHCGERLLRGVRRVQGKHLHRAGLAEPGEVCGLVGQASLPQQLGRHVGVDRRPRAAPRGHREVERRRVRARREGRQVARRQAQLSGILFHES